MGWLTEFLGPNPEIDALTRGAIVLLIGNRALCETNLWWRMMRSPIRFAGPSSPACHQGASNGSVMQGVSSLPVRYRPVGTVEMGSFPEAELPLRG